MMGLFLGSFFVVCFPIGHYIDIGDPPFYFLVMVVLEDWDAGDLPKCKMPRWLRVSERCFVST